VEGIMDILVRNNYIEVYEPFEAQILEEINRIECGSWDTESMCWRFLLEGKTLDLLYRLKGKYTLSRHYKLVDVYKRLGERFEDKLIAYKYNASTIGNYLKHFGRFLEYVGFRESRINQEWLQSYLVILLEVNQCSASYVNQALCAIKLFCKFFLAEINGIEKLDKMKLEKKLPQVLSIEEVNQILSASMNPKHRLMLKLAYSGGLRVSDIINLKVTDVDCKELLIRINHGDGALERFTLLSEHLKPEVEKYKEEFRPSTWMFENPTTGDRLTERTVQRVFKNACGRAFIYKNVSVHVLRHSFAAHMLAKGVEVKLVQELLGHKCLKSTEVYCEVVG